jgi:hypothetical protein
MAMRIRVTTRTDLYEKRKQEHIGRGYRIEDERPIPVNGFCYFITSSPRSRREGLRTRMASWSELRAVAKNSTPLMSPASFQTPKTSDLKLPA